MRSGMLSRAIEDNGIRIETFSSVSEGVAFAEKRRARFLYGDDSFEEFTKDGFILCFRSSSNWYGFRDLVP